MSILIAAFREASARFPVDTQDARVVKCFLCASIWRPLRVSRVVFLNSVPRNKRRRSVAVVLLCLIAYAFSLSVTHHHAPSPQSASTLSVQSADASSSKNLPQSSDDSSCNSCRASRSFNSSERCYTLVVQFSRQEHIRETLPSQPLSDALALVESSRGPPLA